MADLIVSFLDKQLRAASIPIDGIAKQNGDYRIDFRPEATAEQRIQAAAIVAAFDPVGAIARENEIEQAPGMAYNYFAAHPAAVAFVRLSAAEQEAQIELMTLAQLKTVVKHLTVAGSMLIKRELL